MGKVFSLEQITREEFPEHSDGASQQEAAKQIGLNMVDIFGNGLANAQAHPVGWYLYGSAVAGYNDSVGPNRRSDVDLLSIVDNLEAPHVSETISLIIKGIEKRYRVGVGHSQLTVEEVLGADAVDPFYVSHIETTVQLGWNYRQRKQRIYSQPTNADRAIQAVFKKDYPFEQLLSFANSYLNARYDNVARIAEAQPEVRQLQVLFETSRNVGRKLTDLYVMFMRAYESDQRYDADLDDFASPVDVFDNPVSNFVNVAEDTDVGSEDDHAAILKLGTIDEEYSMLLENVISGAISLDDYNKWLQGIRPEGLYLARRVIKFGKILVAKITELAKADPNYGTELYLPYSGSDMDIDDVYERRPVEGLAIEQYDLNRMIARMR